VPVEGEGKYVRRNRLKALLNLPRSSIDPLHTLVKDTACYPVPVKVICNSEQTKRHVVDPYKFSNWLVIIVELWSMDNKAIHIRHLLFYPEPRGPRVLPVSELVLWYGMFAPCGRLLGTTGFARGAP
jgi:hypothetical protein